MLPSPTAPYRPLPSPTVGFYRFYPVTRPVWRQAIALILPEGLILLATVLLVRLDSLRDTLVSLATFYPGAVFATAVFLAMRFRRGRLMFSLVALALAAWGPLAAGTPAGQHLAFDAVAVLLPLNLLALSLLSDRGILTPAGILRWGALLVQTLVIATLSSAAPAKADAVFRASVLSGALMARAPCSSCWRCGSPWAPAAARCGR